MKTNPLGQQIPPVHVAYRWYVYLVCLILTIYTCICKPCLSSAFQIFRSIHFCIFAWWWLFISPFFIVFNGSSFGGWGGCHMNVVFVNLLNQPFRCNRNTFQWQLWNADRVYFSRQVYEMHSGYICQWRIVWNVHTGYFKKCQWQLHEMYSLSTTVIYMKYTDMYSRTYYLICIRFRSSERH